MHLLYAADAARRAVELDPNLPEATFNLAVALTWLHVPRTAAAQWDRFLELEPSGPWATEARESLARLAAQRSGAGWHAARARLSGGGQPTDAEVTDAVTSYPYEVRRLGERELLGHWVDEVLAGDAAAAADWLARARQIAVSLSRQRGEALLEHETGRLAALTTTGRPRLLTENARALRRFLDGAGRYDRQEYESARVQLGSARALLRKQQSSLAAIADLYLAVILSYSDLPAAAEKLDSLIERAPPDYLALRGQALWMLGIVASSRRQFEDATSYYGQAIPLIERSEGPTRAATLRLLLAESFDSRGEVARGWRHRIQALEKLSLGGDARRRYGAAFEAAQALARHGHDDLALFFLDEAVTRLGEYGAPAGGVEIHLERARVFIGKREIERAREEISRARAYVARVEDGGLRRRLGAALDLTTGMAEVGQVPLESITVLQSAYREHQGSGYRFDELAYLAALARAQLATADVAAARETLRTAVESYEETRQQASEMVSSIDSMRRAHTLFDQLIALSLDGATVEEAKAFYWAERSRAQTLLDLRSRSGAVGEGDQPGVAGIADLQRGLPPGTVLLEYAVLPERTVCWVVSSETVRFRSLAISSGRLTRLTDAFAQGLVSGDSPAASDDQAAELYELLLAPLGLDLSATRRLIVIPDGPLSDLPFTALVEPRTGRYLIEMAAVAFAPSATLFMLAEQGTARRPIGRPLVVGSARLHRGPYQHLPPLLYAEREATAVASVFPGSTILRDEAATTQRILELLPEHDSLHYTGHALSSGEDWTTSGLVLAPGPRGGDGLLRVTALMGRPRIDLRLVVLSACETLAGYDGGREGTVGLAQAFFALGVPSVVGTRWPVDDRLSFELMQSFYESVVAGESPAWALRKAVVERLQQAGSRPSAQTWAAFAVIGV